MENCCKSHLNYQFPKEFSKISHAKMFTSSALFLMFSFCSLILAQANLSAAVQPSPAKEVMSVSSCSYEHTDHQEIQNLMDDFSNLCYSLSPDSSLIFFFFFFLHLKKKISITFLEIVK